MADGFSTDSYPKPAPYPAQKSMLDQIQQYQQIDSNSIAISQAKLKQINDQFGLMNNELSTLANDPSVTKEQAKARLTTFANTFGFKPEVTNHMLNELDTAPDVKSFAQNALVRGASIQEKVNTLYGTPGFDDNGQTRTPTMRSPLRNGGAPVPVGGPIQYQNKPDTETVDKHPTIIDADGKEVPNPNYGSKKLIGPATINPPAGMQQDPGGLPGQGISPRLPIQNNQPTPAQPPRPMLPVGKGNLTNDGQITGVDVQNVPTPNQQVANSYPTSSGIPTSLPPMYEEGRKAYVQDQQNASAKMQALKPAIQALPLMQSKGFLSGPLTDQFTKAVAGLKSIGLVNIDENADPTAVRQEVSKKLAQYISSSPVGQRSDAAQTLKEASSPNPNVQILPALIKLTKDAVALDRVEAMMPNSFKGQDYQNYIKHKGTFPQSVDEKALTLDLEPEEKSKAMVDDMATKLKSKNNRDRNEADKFFKTLRMAKDQGFYQ